MTTDTQTIPLNRLFHAEANVRRTGKAEGMEGLATSLTVVVRTKASSRSSRRPVAAAASSADVRSRSGCG